MYKALIVDDEQYICEGIRSHIAWEAFGVDEVFIAGDGIEALEMVQKQAPHIVITDIRMPGMDGLALAKHLREDFPQIKVVILSGYADFSYAQTALRYGVVDFVLKPTKVSKISDAIAKAIDALRAEEHSRSRIQELEHTISDNQKLILEKQLADVILDRLPVQGLAFAQGFSLQGFVMLLIEQSFENPSRQRADTAFASLANIVSLVFDQFRSLFIPLTRTAACVILRTEGRLTDDAMRDILVACEEVVSIPAENTLSVSFSIAISAYHEGCAQLSQAYREAHAAMQNRFYEQNSVYLYLKNKQNCGGAEPAFESYVDRILSCARSRQEHEAVGLLEELIARLEAVRQPIDYVKNMAAFLYSLLVRLMPQNTRQALSTGYGSIYNAGSIEEVSNFLKQQLLEICSETQTANEISNRMVVQTLDFISKHYHENVKLLEIADAVHVNGSYLSRLFRKVTGETITDALTRMRISRARQLLLSTDMKFYEIAAAVGIEDAAYFSILFKKHTGYNPRQYKLLHGGQSEKNKPAGGNA